MTFSRLYDRLIRVRLLGTIISILGLSSISLATTTLVGVSGVSNAIQSTTDTSWTVYGGIQTGKTLSNFTDCTTTSACNTCTGSNYTGTPPQHYPCNQSGVFTNTILTFTGRTDVTTAGTKWLLCDGTTDRYSSTDLNTSLTVAWSNLCGDNGGDSSCTGGVSKTLTFGAAIDCNALNASTEKVSVKFYARDVDISAVSTYDPTDCTLNAGACLFELYPGDGKLYLEDDSLSIDTNSGVTNVPYTGVVFFMAEQDPSETGNDQATFERVFTSSDTRIIPFNIATDGSGLEGTYIDSLSNDVKYCFKMGTLDAAGNIDHISSIDCQAADCETTSPAVCMTPSEVVGILSDKNCFIATAAFGSGMDRHVQMLREFRNEFMAPYWLGRKLVKAYYRTSPVLANWIAQHENARTLTRWLLWPVMGWAELALKFGWAVVIAPFLLSGLAFIAFRKRFKRLGKA